MSDKKHAKLSPSSAYRWLHCPASVKLCETLQVESKPNEHSALGTLAHTVGEKILMGSTAADWLNTRHEVDGFGFLVTSDILKPVDEYVCYVRERQKLLNADMQLEVFCSLRYLGVDGLDGGTADCLLVNKKKRVLEVVDYKHGVSLVDPANNTQLMQYALGALMHLGVDEFDGDWDVDLTIVQPRAFSGDGSIRTWYISSNDLFRWRDKVLVPGAKKTADKSATFSPGDKTCKYCPAAGDCPALMKKAESAVVKDFGDLVKVTQLTAEQKIKLLDNRKLIMELIQSVAASVQSEIQNGSKEYIGKYKLVEEKKNTTYTAEAKDKDFSELLEYLSSDKVFESKLMAISKVKKNLIDQYGKKEAEKILDKVTYVPEGGVTLAPESDKRKAVEVTTSDDFKHLEGGETEK